MQSQNQPESVSFVIMMKHDKYKTNSYRLVLTLHQPQSGVNKSKEVEKVDFWRGPEMIQ